MNSEREQHIAELRQAVQVAPEDAQGHFQLGFALIRSGQIEEGLAECRAAVRLNPNALEWFEPIGQELKEVNQWDAAAAVYREAIQLLEETRTRGSATGRDIFLLTYLYCLNGDVAQAESTASATTEPQRPFVKWLWGKLQAEYGFRPPNAD